jgi:hypothetical protein
MFITPFVAALLIGSFWTGVGTTAVLSNANHLDRTRSDVVITATTDDHITACHARYRSYDESTDSWLGRDGVWHVCTL